MNPIPPHVAFTARFDRTEVPAEAGVPDSFSYKDELRIGNGEVDGAIDPSARVHVEAFDYGVSRAAMRCSSGSTA